GNSCFFSFQSLREKSLFLFTRIAKNAHELSSILIHEQLMVIHVIFSFLSQSVSSVKSVVYELASLVRAGFSHSSGLRPPPLRQGRKGTAPTKIAIAIERPPAPSKIDNKLQAPPLPRPLKGWGTG
ncbi:MAG: hypothetical protein IKX36_01455, partial [Prevotella sp.]|nr:hypothetical protein [Prevotella sp.]